MTAAIITNLRAAGAVFELAEMSHWFPTWRDAVDEAERRGMEYTLIHPSDAPPVVLTVSPALTS